MEMLHGVIFKVHACPGTEAGELHSYKPVVLRNRISRKVMIRVNLGLGWFGLLCFAAWLGLPRPSLKRGLWGGRNVALNEGGRPVSHVEG
jgi:hypothetical protein